MTNKKIAVEISQKTIISTILILLGLYLFRHVTGVIVGLFLSFLAVVALNPWVNFLESKRVPRWASSLTILLMIIATLSYLVVSLIRPLIVQTQSFILQFPLLLERLAPYNIDFGLITNQFSAAPKNILEFATGTFSSLVTFITLIVITFHLLQDRPNLKKHLVYLFGENKGNRLNNLFLDLEHKLGHWVRGEVLLMLIIGILNYLGFVLIGLPSAIPLAVIAGILELIPNVGPTIAAIPAAIVGFSISPTHGLMAIGLATLVQQLENNFIVPKVMQHAADLHPVITITAILIGFQLGGPFLAILSLPLVLTLQVVVRHLKASKDSVEIC